MWGCIMSFQQGPHLPTTFSHPHQDSARVCVGLCGAGRTGELGGLLNSSRSWTCQKAP